MNITFEVWRKSARKMMQQASVSAAGQAGGKCERRQCPPSPDDEPAPAALSAGGRLRSASNRFVGTDPAVAVAMPATVVTTWLLLDVLPVVVGVAVVGVVMLIWRGFCWARRLGRRSTKPAASDLVDDLAPVAYDSLQRDLSEGIQAIEDVQVQVQNLYSGVQGAQALHSEVETCFSAALDAASIEDTVAPEVTVAELEQMLQEETRKRWSVIVIKDMVKDGVVA